MMTYLHTLDEGRYPRSSFLPMRHFNELLLLIDPVNRRELPTLDIFDVAERVEYTKELADQRAHQAWLDDEMEDVG